MSPNGFAFVLPHFNETQQKTIQDMGIWRLSYLHSENCSKAYINPYAHKFRVYDINQIDITPMDVHLALGILYGHRHVSQCWPVGEKSGDYRIIEQQNYGLAPRWGKPTY